MATLDRRVAALEAKASPDDSLIVFRVMLGRHNSPDLGILRMARWDGNAEAEQWHLGADETQEAFKARVSNAVNGRGFVVLRCYGADDAAGTQQ